jgi:hypothetical protein
MSAPAFPVLGVAPSNIQNTAGLFSFASGWPVAYLIATAIFAIGLLIGSLTHVSHNEFVDRSAPTAAEHPTGSRLQADVVAQITGTVDCKWEGSGFRGQGSGDGTKDSPLSPLPSPLIHLGDTLALRSGLLEIAYDTGAKVILQGPVTYEVDSAAGGYLSVGKLSAKLEKKSEFRGPWSESANHKSEIIHQTFSVRTPTAVVTDLGTEFGVAVREDGASEVCVLQGAVRISGSQASGTQELRAGQAVRVEWSAPGAATRILSVAPKATSRFVRSLRTPGVRAYKKAVLADRPLFYWSFDEPEGTAFEQVRHLPEQALRPSGGATRASHAAMGTGLGLGRAADFSRAAGCFSADGLGYDTQMPGAWAVEFWIQFTGDLRGHTKQYILNVGGSAAGGWNRPGVVFDWDHGREDNTLEMYATSGKWTSHGPQIADHFWHHVVLVFYGNNEGFGTASRVDVVIDGEPKTIERNNFSAEFDASHAILAGASTAAGLEPMQGRLDELAVYDLQGLSAGEIEARMAEMALRHRAAARSSSQIASEGDNP